MSQIPTTVDTLIHPEWIVPIVPRGTVLENYSLAISRDRAKQCSRKIQELLGYSMQFPFIGFVNGRDPIRLLED